MTILEGTWEEVTLHAPELMGRRVRVTVLEDTPLPEGVSAPPNEGMLAALRFIEQHQANRKETSGADTPELIRKARDGEMYGFDSGK